MIDQETIKRRSEALDLYMDGVIPVDELCHRFGVSLEDLMSAVGVHSREDFEDLFLG